ncbi:uracil-DNA glycosylase-like protein [Crassisporium funariophilum]|nr:uracil-DNA glycosylase-like protein [Crassisporium funariophilum]
MTDKPTVYLEDIDSSLKAKRERPDDGEEKEINAPSSSAPAPAKRQRTLGEMFSGSQGKKDTSTPSGSSIKPSGAPIVASSSSSRPRQGGLLKLNAIPFSMAAYQESLSEEEKELLQLECEAMGKSWLKVLKDEIKKPYFIALKKFLLTEGVRGVDDTPPLLPIYPAPRNIYAWSNTPLGKVKVVILGQDPYHGPGQAHGLCFSVPVGVTTPPSLRNIYTEIKTEYPEFNVPKHGNLSAWADNGVLMLNSCLTVRQGDANSHANKGWEQFTDYVLDMVDKYGGANLPSRLGGSGGGGNGFGRGVVFLAWGSYAAKRVAKLNKTKHLILLSAHPSPYSAHKGFLGNGHFKSANQWLEQKYGVDGSVDWCCLNDGLPTN